MSGRVLLIPVEGARLKQLKLPGSPEDWEQSKCPKCLRVCWVHARAARRILTGEASAICTLCALEEGVSASYGRMLKAEPGPQMTLEQARERFPPMWTIYREPRDMPGVAFCSRVWFGTLPTDQVMTAPTLEEMRTKVRAAGGFACMGRSLHDDPCIVEVWL